MKLNKKEDSYILKYSYNESINIIVNFQGKEITLDTIIDEYAGEIKKNKLIEILPCVYMKINRNINKCRYEYNPQSSLSEMIKVL